MNCPEMVARILDLLETLPPDISEPVCELFLQFLEVTQKEFEVVIRKNMRMAHLIAQHYKVTPAAREAVGTIREKQTRFPSDGLAELVRQCKRSS
jgi:hypothetical protein